MPKRIHYVQLNCPDLDVVRDKFDHLFGDSAPPFRGGEWMAPLSDLPVTSSFGHLVFKLFDPEVKLTFDPPNIELRGSWVEWKDEDVIDQHLKDADRSFHSALNTTCNIIGGYYSVGSNGCYKNQMAAVGEAISYEVHARTIQAKLHLEAQAFNALVQVNDHIERIVRDSTAWT